jgi:hypothetical protein
MPEGRKTMMLDLKDWAKDVFRKDLPMMTMKRVVASFEQLGGHVHPEQLEVFAVYLLHVVMEELGRQESPLLKRGEFLTHFLMALNSCLEEYGIHMMPLFHVIIPSDDQPKEVDITKAVPPPNSKPAGGDS